MKKDVFIAISSLQQFEGCEPEQVELVSSATLYRRQGKYYVAYDESELTGLQGTHTTIKMDGPSVALIRTGTNPSHMLFIEGERHVGLYQTGYGAMTVSIHTSRVYNTVDDNGGELLLDYTIEVDSVVTGEHHFAMAVTIPKPSGDNKQ